MNSKEWIAHFRKNATVHRVDWTLAPNITEEEIRSIIYSLQAWQLGETSDGSNLLRAATKYAHSINDLDYIEAVKLFIKEEQKHGNNLGLYIDAIGEKESGRIGVILCLEKYDTSTPAWSCGRLLLS